VATDDSLTFGATTATRSFTTATTPTGAPLVSSLSISGAERRGAMWGLGGVIAAVAGLAALL